MAITMAITMASDVWSTPCQLHGIEQFVETP